MNPYVLKTLGHMLNDTALEYPCKVVTIAMVRPAPQEKFLEVKELPDSVPVLALTKEQQDKEYFDPPNKNVVCFPKKLEDGTIEPVGQCDVKMERDTIVYTPDGDLCFVMNSDVAGLYQHHCALTEAVNRAGAGDCGTPPTLECSLLRSTAVPSTSPNGDISAASAAEYVSIFQVALAMALASLSL
eukprot:gnl/MRDRNA2_/MRDRNA2_156639_c0_seq1.p1 gnl/MRDRNA2_/MRDRNA2_156639_c0~~gnl/MRDRNA2_/MRDRNA2_156639_c0_seq1.p1  ORF type:complete len:186 (-),score=32.94 gnl/MRDRNA2_/MRDRNA2_156639_c0_seq1:180-737(-)